MAILKKKDKKTNPSVTTELYVICCDDLSRNNNRKILYNHYQTNLTYHNFMSLLPARFVVQRFVIATQKTRASTV